MLERNFTSSNPIDDLVYHLAQILRVHICCEALAAFDDLFKLEAWLQKVGLQQITVPHLIIEGQLVPQIHRHELQLHLPRFEAIGQVKWVCLIGQLDKLQRLLPLILLPLVKYLFAELRKHELIQLGVKLASFDAFFRVCLQAPKPGLCPGFFTRGPISQW